MIILVIFVCFLNFIITSWKNSPLKLVVGILCAGYYVSTVSRLFVLTCPVEVWVFMSPRPVHTSSWLWSFRSTVCQGQPIRNWNTPPELFIHFRYDYARNWENPTDLYIHFGYEYDCQSQLIRNWENPTQLFIHFGYDYVRNLESPMELFIRFSYVYVRAKWQAQENIIPLHYNELSAKVCFTNFKNRSINNCWEINTSKRNPDKKI